MSQAAGPPNLTQKRGMSDYDQDEELHLNKSSSPKYLSRAFNSSKHGNVPFVPLRNNVNRDKIVQKKVRNPSAGYLEYAQDMARPTGSEAHSSL